jgi:hypothetical protein
VECHQLLFVFVLQSDQSASESGAVVLCLSRELDGTFGLYGRVFAISGLIVTRPGKLVEPISFSVCH